MTNEKETSTDEDSLKNNVSLDSVSKVIKLLENSGCPRIRQEHIDKNQYPSGGKLSSNIRESSGLNGTDNSFAIKEAKQRKCLILYHAQDEKNAYLYIHEQNFKALCKLQEQCLKRRNKAEEDIIAKLTKDLNL